ncbi:MAG: hypothetical protein WCI74_08285 [Actinomycetes bacterium]
MELPVADAYTTKNLPTTIPSAVSIGDGGGVVQAANGFYYFGSLQSGCIYKESSAADWETYVYCIPSWGAGGDNAATYSLAEDNSGHVYAIYQGTTDNNTIILRVTPNGTSTDTVEALQLTAYARSVALAVSADGSRLWADGVSMTQYESSNANAILQIANPVWGSPVAPTPTKATATTLPGSAAEIWLMGMTYDQANNTLIIADNSGGFYLDFL